MGCASGRFVRRRVRARSSEFDFIRSGAKYAPPIFAVDFEPANRQSRRPRTGRRTPLHAASGGCAARPVEMAFAPTRMSARIAPPRASLCRPSRARRVVFVRRPLLRPRRVPSTTRCLADGGDRDPATPGAKIGLGPLAGAYDAVGRWLVDNPAPQWLVNSPLKTKVTELLAGTLDADFNLEASETRVRELVASDDVVVFSATYCPFRAAAKAALRAEGVPFTAVEWNQTPGGAGFAPALASVTGRSSIPHVFIGGVSVGGCNDGDPGIRPLIKQGGLDAALERCSEETRAARAAHLARGKR